MTDTCKYITSSGEGTNYCILSAVNADELEDLRRIVKVMRDPLVNFGSPMVVGTSIPAEAIAGCFFGGDSIHSVAADYGLTAEQVEIAVRYVGNWHRCEEGDRP